ncbi:MAG: four helix bundle protein [Acidobacteria bacterium RIFCSPLOWO2_02_FULL_60_20]|nr:MAG: four helix bundle protein [Acidobacteria bacterium RIFCSPLOWO2_02_FULL_60_20]
MKNYKELGVWQKSIDLVEQVYQVTSAFPLEEKYGLSSQSQRAATSIPANIAEGWARGTTKEYIQFLKVARGSLMELETHLIVANRLKFLPEQKVQSLVGAIAEIGRMLNGLIKSLNTR